MTEWEKKIISEIQNILIMYGLMASRQQALLKMLKRGIKEFANDIDIFFDENNYDKIKLDYLGYDQILIKRGIE